MQLYINIDVDDLDKAITFYTNALGLQLSRRLFGGLVAELTGAAAPIHLLTKAAGSPAAAGAGTRFYERHWTPVHLDFCVDDIDHAVRRAAGAGARQEGEVRDYEWGKIATFSDPFGHGFCLMQLAPDGYDSVAVRLA